MNNNIAEGKEIILLYVIVIKGGNYFE